MRCESSSLLPCTSLKDSVEISSAGRTWKFLSLASMTKSWKSRISLLYTYSKLDLQLSCTRISSVLVVLELLFRAKKAKCPWRCQTTSIQAGFFSLLYSLCLNDQIEAFQALAKVWESLPKTRVRWLMAAIWTAQEYFFLSYYCKE